MFRAFTLALLLLAVTPACGVADTRIGTWNLEHLSVRPNKDLQSIAKVARQVDFLAIQELMNEDALSALARELTRQTGTRWSSMASHAVGRASYKEMYGFIWRDDAVAYEDGAVTYLDRGDRFEREPYSARFKSLKDNTYFVAATVHILYGKGQADRASEITALADYWAWLQATYAGTRHLLLMGDFNTPPASASWGALGTRARPLVLTGASTLSAKNGQFANLYDNIFVSQGSPLKANQVQVFNYPAYLKVTHAQGRASISDHAPVFLTANLAAGAPGPVAGASPAPSAPATEGVVGNQKTKVYHLAHCPSYGAVSAKNRVNFASEADAITHHYRRAGNCHPG